MSSIAGQLHTRSGGTATFRMKVGAVAAKWVISLPRVCLHVSQL